MSRSLSIERTLVSSGSDRSRDFWEKMGKKGLTGPPNPFEAYKLERLLGVIEQLKLQGKEILDAGCGTGRISMFLNSKAAESVLGLDFSKNMIRFAAARNGSPDTRFLLGSAQRLPFKDEAFDMVFVITVLMHNSNELGARQLVDEIKRVVRKNGKIFIAESVRGRRQLYTRAGVIRKIGEYERLFRGSKLYIERSGIISSPFYEWFALPLRVFLYSKTSYDRAAGSLAIAYSRIGTQLTRTIDIMWQGKSGLQYFLLGKSAANTKVV